VLFEKKGNGMRSGKRLLRWLFALFSVIMFAVSAGCGESVPGPSMPHERPREFVQEIAFPGGTEWLHTCGEYLVAVSRKSDVYVWDWDDLQKPPRVCKGGGGLSAFVLPDLILTRDSSLDGPCDPAHPVWLENLDSGRELCRWAFGPVLFCHEMQPSRNGRWVAFRAEANGIPTVHVGLLAPESKDILWVAEFEQKSGTLMASRIVPSEDGRYIAVVGIHNGAWAAVASVKAKKVLWSMTQKGAVQFYDVAFSPDSSVIYAGGTSGELFAYDVEKGGIARRYLLGENMDTEYGCCRITCVAASSDGRLVAGGTGPDGKVYLWRVATGNREAVWQTRQSTIMGLAFSPDSKRLAVTGVENRTIEIWDVGTVHASP